MGKSEPAVFDERCVEKLLENGEGEVEECKEQKSGSLGFPHELMSSVVGLRLVWLSGGALL